MRFRTNDKGFITLPFADFPHTASEPAERYDAEWIPLIKQAADNISHALGYTPKKQAG